MKGMLSQKQDDLITVIIPVYNVERELPRCVKSVLKQTYKNLEVILVDDGSTDGSSGLCDEFRRMDNRCKVYHTSNNGLSAARNYGIARANGDYVTLVDSDDYVDEDYIEYLYQLLQDSGFDLAVCQHRVELDNGNTLEYGKKGKETLSGKECIERMLYHDVIDTSAWGKLYARHLFETVQYPAGMLYEDIGTTYKLFLQCESVAVGYESKYAYVRRRGSIVNRSYNRKKLDLLEMTDRMGEDVVNHYPDLKAAVLRRRVYARISTLNQMLDAKGVEKERKEILSFIKNERHAILRDAKAPKRDKAALVLLGISYRLYRVVWLCYQNYLWRGGESADVS